MMVEMLTMANFTTSATKFEMPQAARDAFFEAANTTTSQTATGKRFGYQTDAETGAFVSIRELD